MTEVFDGKMSGGEEGSEGERGGRMPYVRERRMLCGVRAR
jgi:hypothetical protein